MTISVRKVVNDASVLLSDATKKHWPDKELLSWANAGQLQIVLLRPDAYTNIASVQLVEGTRQTLPAADLKLLDIPRNMGLDGNTPGNACFYLHRRELDQDNLSWHTATANAAVDNWAYNQEIPRTWWCSPPQPAASQGYVELHTSRAPPTMNLDNVDGYSGADSNLGLDDIYLNPLLEFMLFRSHSKNAEHTQIGGKADLAWRIFLQSLGLKTESDMQTDPRKSQPPHYQPNLKGDQGAFSE